MLDIAGSAKRSFVFPADLSTAFLYYSDLSKTLPFLPHISVLRKHTEDQYRVLYSTTEMGIYQVRIICDFQAECDQLEWGLRIHPLEDIKPPSIEAGFYSLTGYGLFNSESDFFADGKRTLIVYRLKLAARLPVPAGIRLMPKAVLNTIAHSITDWRIQEIAEGFIEKSIRAFKRK